MRPGISNRLWGIYRKTLMMEGTLRSNQAFFEHYRLEELSKINKAAIDALVFQESLLTAAVRASAEEASANRSKLKRRLKKD